jgi:hypothetical protein
MILELSTTCLADDISFPREMQVYPCVKAQHKFVERGADELANLGMTAWGGAVGKTVSALASFRKEV